MKFKPNLQRRLWLGTVWLNHISDSVTQEDDGRLIEETFRGAWSAMIGHPCVDFARGQIEISETGHYHIQCAIHTSDSKRWGWMAKNLPAHWEPASNWDAVLKYVRKTDSRVATLEEFGTAPNRPKTDGHGSAKKRAIEYLKAGKDPQWIAINDPDAYFTHHRAIDRLYQMVYMAWRGGVDDGGQEE